MDVLLDVIMAILWGFLIIGGIIAAFSDSANYPFDDNGSR